MNTKLRKKAENKFEKYCFKLINNTVFEKLWERYENVEILNLQEQKGEEFIQHQNQIIILQSYSQKIY